MKHQATGKPHLCSELVSINWADQTGNTQTTTANLEEIAETEASVLADVNIPCGTRIRIYCQGNELAGVVRSTASDPILGHFITIEFDPQCRWSEKWFTPEHLLALWLNMEESNPQYLPRTAA